MKDLSNIIERVNAYMQKNPNASRSNLIRDCKTSGYTLDKLDAIGVKLPKKMTASAAGKMAKAAAIRNGNQFRIRREQA